MNTGIVVASGALLACAALPVATAAEGEATFAVRTLVPEVALKAAQAALKHCRDQGFQVAVAVVDRAGVTQVMLRDRYAGAHTPVAAAGKAWTAASFRTATLELAAETQAGRPSSGLRHLPGTVFVGGGVPIEAAGTLAGAIGVSGAPGGDADAQCARAGIDAIRDALDF